MRAAVEAAHEWGASSLTRRTGVLFRLRELLDANRDELAAAVTREHGKVLEDARGEVARGIENVEFACGIPSHLKGSSNSEISTGVDIRTVLEPLGVVAGITPFNFPVMVPLWMMANAIACGNCFVLKPSEKDPSASLLLADLRAPGRLSRRGLQRGAGRPRGGGHVVGPPRRRRDLLRGQHPGGASRLRDRDAARQAGPGPRRREEPHGGPSRRRPRRRGRCSGVGGLRVGRGAVHGDLRRRRGRVGGRPARRGRSPRGSPTSSSVPATTPRP